MRWLRTAVRRWLGIPDIESALLAFEQVTDALTDQGTIDRRDIGQVVRIVLEQQGVLQRWSRGSEVLRSIESRHKASQAKTDVPLVIANGN